MFKTVSFCEDPQGCDANIFLLCSSKISFAVYAKHFLSVKEVELSQGDWLHFCLISLKTDFRKGYVFVQSGSLKLLIDLGWFHLQTFWVFWYFQTLSACYVVSCWEDMVSKVNPCLSFLWRWCDKIVGWQQRLQKSLILNWYFSRRTFESALSETI